MITGTADLIDMAYAKDRKKVFATLEKALEADKSPTNILTISEFGLVEMTRKRITDSLTRSLTSPCSHCEGSGMVLTPETVGHRVLRILWETAPRRAVAEGAAQGRNAPLAARKALTVHVHPNVAAFLSNG